MSNSLIDVAAKIRAAKVVLVDWDGCLVQSGSLLPGARELLEVIGDKTFILSNNSTDVPETFQTRLNGIGVDLPRDRIILAGHQTLGQVAVRWRGRKVYLIASPTMRAYAAGLPICLSDNEADVVVLLRDTEFSYLKLTQAANILRRCGRLVLSNPDLTHPADHDAVVPETGALFAALSACLDGSVQIEAIGKPEPFLFETALAAAGVKPDSAVMIGDNPATDGAGAAASRIPFVMVRPGTEISLEAILPLLKGAPNRGVPSEALRR